MRSGDAAVPSAPRRPELDALRGLLLVLMTLTHLPTRLNAYSSQPFGFVSAAEGFVFLSAFLVGGAHAKAWDTPGRLWRSLRGRALEVYTHHVGLLLFAFTVIGTVGWASHRPAVLNLLDFYHQEPVTALWSSLALLYCPPLLDILPLYVVLLVLTPVLLLAAREAGWAKVVCLSGLVWLWAQLGLKQMLYAGLGKVAWVPVKMGHSGAFDLFAWQFLWVVGVWRGSLRARGHVSGWTGSRVLLGGVWGLVLLFLLARYAWPSVPFLVDHPALLDKWTLGPLRLVNFLALALLADRGAPRVYGWLRPRVLVLLGSASLPVFSVHLVLCLSSLALINENEAPLDSLEEVAVLVVTFASMLLVALRHQRRGSVS
ncbi:acyltransferase family protein [Myxococcus stipitatus DSM 14675]|uniref:Acyltransferase family protein n=1 Tax=Myxococcus stipitatus (strain DSM 14675 / JCM 12634 / Mx s8) TaxID=1278073 RepID=L7UGS9_MYXSD|nr:OpgC domain-containing protein [Myxococcus stipitatus]AGC47075.1 acyltransferase family protein [Myxococcus stipitatus DSM 14675]